MNTASQSTNLKRVQTFERMQTRTPSLYKNNQYQNLIRPQPLRLQDHPLQANSNEPAAKHLARLLMQASQLIRGGSVSVLPNQQIQQAQMISMPNQVQVHKRPTIMVHQSHTSNSNTAPTKLLNFKFQKEEGIPSTTNTTSTSSTSTIPSNDSKTTPHHDLSESTVKLGKRARKSENQLSTLRQALAYDKLWSREKVEELSKSTGMSETQVYKWWWDQTRKRAKKLQKKHRQQQVLQQLKHQNLFENKDDCSVSNLPQEYQAETADTQVEFQLPMMDEFGGYSSRLRMNHSQESFEVQELTSLLGIDVEQKAKQIVMQHRKSKSTTSNSQLFNSRNNTY